MKPNLIQVIFRIITAYFKHLTDLLQLASLEARLAVKTFVNIALLVFIAFILLISTWLSLLSLLFFYLVSMHFSFVFSISMVVLLNIILLTVIVLAILQIKENLSFPATRRHIHFIPKELQEIENEPIKKAN